MIVGVVCGDFIELARELPKADLVVTSPPYNLAKEYGDKCDDLRDDYWEWTQEWLRAALDCTTPCARLCVNIPLDTSGGQPFYARFVSVALGIGWKYRTSIVWCEGNISRRTAWGSWRSPSAPNIIAPVEMIVVLHRDSWKLPRRGKADITRDEFIEWTLGLWSFPGESAKRVGHPAPFPVELPKRLIKLFSYRGDTVLDPFCGSGTTLVAAKMMGRNAIGVDIHDEYCELTKRRLDKEANHEV